MANNRMFLVYRPTGEAVLLGKRSTLGWHVKADGLEAKLTKLFESAVKAAIDGNFSQDDFAIAMEQGKNQPYVLSDWKYTQIPGQLDIDVSAPDTESLLIGLDHQDNPELAAKS